MAELAFMDGNTAIARGAIAAGCRYFFGYPITPQNEIPEYMSRELPKLGGAYVQSECETASIYMVYGGAAAGARVMTSTSSCGFSLMQEGISYILEARMPAVIAHVMRMGPGIGTGGQQGQADYLQVTKGGGHGGYRCISLAASSVQECYDFMQLAFYLADLYRILVIVVADFLIVRMAEPVEIKKLEFGPLPEKDWALKGKDKKGGLRSMYISGVAMSPPAYHTQLAETLKTIKEKEIRYETYRDEDADILVVAYGSSARLAKKAVDMAREEGIRAGVLRPITLWPFPEEAIRQKASQVKKMLVVEDGPEQMIEDVRGAVQGKVPVSFVGVWDRYTPPGLTGGGSGIVYPEKILEKMRGL